MTITKKLTTQPERILSAALKCISNYGYANVSMRDIASEAGVVLSQLNYYYKNKEGLFIELIKDVQQEYRANIHECLKKGATPGESLALLIDYFRDLTINNPEIIRLLYEAVNLALWSEIFKKFIRNLFDEVSEEIKKSIYNNADIKNRFKKYSPETISHLLWGTIFGTVINFILHPQDEQVNELFHLIKFLYQP
ncbi:MAG: TetR/AcrR family transcriptional regulator [Brevinematales bacterium]|jgi:AcrR family transcriptional regulator